MKRQLEKEVSKNQILNMKLSKIQQEDGEDAYDLELDLIYKQQIATLAMNLEQSTKSAAEMKSKLSFLEATLKKREDLIIGLNTQITQQDGSIRYMKKLEKNYRELEATLDSEAKKHHEEIERIQSDLQSEIRILRNENSILKNKLSDLKHVDIDVDVLYLNLTCRSLKRMLYHKRLTDLATWSYQSYLLKDECRYLGRKLSILKRLKA